MIYQVTEERFLEDVKNHKMTVKLDKELHRDLVFSDGSSINYFRLVTWPGYLCICGDMGTYVFSRTKDMFEFFNHGQKNNLSINPGYWHEKMQSDSRFAGAKTFNADEMETAVRKIVDEEWEFSNDEERNEVLEDLDFEVFHFFADGHAEAVLCNAVCQYRSPAGHVFQDFWEYSFRDYTPQFIWCLYAIVYGIKKYNEYRTIMENKDNE
jgi:hypothetical protein